MNINDYNFNETYFNSDNNSDNEKDSYDNRIPSLRMNYEGDSSDNKTITRTINSISPTLMASIPTPMTTFPNQMMNGIESKRNARPAHEL